MRLQAFFVLLCSMLSLPAIVEAAPVSGQGTWEATLQARDLNGDGVADAYYDTALDITWLREANYAMASGFDVDGRMNWADAMAWAAGLDVYGVTGWTLPSTVDAESSAAFAPAPESSQMAHMYFSTLGNPTNAVTNTANFENLQLDSYWSSTPVGTTGFVWRFSFETVLPGQPGCLRCRQSLANPVAGGDSGYFAWAVHQGDVITSVPEPGSYALVLLAGICAVVGARRTRRQGDATKSR